MTKKTSIFCPFLATGKLLITSLQFKSCSWNFNLMNWSRHIMMTKVLEKFRKKYQKSKFGCIVTLFTGRNEVEAKVIFSLACVKNSVHRLISHFGSGGVFHLGPEWSPILGWGASHFGSGGFPFWSRGGHQAHSQGENWEGSGPGPQPRGEIKGDLVQAHSQGGKLKGIWSRPTAKGEVQGTKSRPPKIRSMSGRYTSYWNAFLSSVLNLLCGKKFAPHTS